MNQERRAYQADAAGDNARAVINELRRASEGFAEEVERQVREAAATGARAHRKRWVASVQAGANINVAHLLTDDDLLKRLALRVQVNVNLIKSISADVQNRIERAALQSILDGRSNAEFAKAIRNIDGIGRKRARLIARDQTSKLNADMTAFRHEQAGIEYYKWKTILDGRERTSHRRNNGKVFSWRKPPSNTGHPSHDVNCRCKALAVLTDTPEEAIDAGTGKGAGPAPTVEGQQDLITSVAQTLGQDILSMPRDVLLAKQGEVIALRKQVALMQQAADFAERDAEALIAALYGRVPDDKDLALFGNRRNKLIRAVYQRLDVIEQAVEHARQFAR